MITIYGHFLSEGSNCRRRGDQIGEEANNECSVIRGWLSLHRVVPGIYECYLRKGPTRAPTATLGLGFGEVSHGNHHCIDRNQSSSLYDAHIADRVFLNLPRVSRMLSSMRVSFGGGSVHSFSGDGGSNSVCVASASVSAGWLVVSDTVSAFWLFKDAERVGGLANCEGTFEGPTSSANSHWCWLEDVLDAGDDGCLAPDCADCALPDV
ncbi:hypothetical protein F3Y22_tig00117056pilonHSYRG00735 [Hibiscus syriacus]|uniref:Uncharacterized protein n=1 Tax=Hibiscus syriacus TaxID=106335 RepID=A0A6A2WB06_HIBSY|nr:hypothetical protein F3Y22_tig00117056pilonHSYRG00735 [Hibiscus syriacus]